MTKELKHINRPLTADERQQAESIRAAAQQDFPPKAVQPSTPPSVIPAMIHDMREQRGWTRYELGQRASVASTVVRAIERGEDVPLSQFHAIVSALGLTVELVEQS